MDRRPLPCVARAGHAAAPQNGREIPDMKTPDRPIALMQSKKTAGSTLNVERPEHSGKALPSLLFGVAIALVAVGVGMYAFLVL